MTQAETILAARTDARMSQDHLARAAGVSTRTVMRAEAGHNISVESVRAIFAVLDIDAGDVPVAVSDGVTGEALLALVSQDADWPTMRTDVEALCMHVADVVPSPRLVLRPDVVAMQRTYARNQGVSARRTGRNFFRGVARLWLGLWFGGQAALAAGYLAWTHLVGAVGEGGNLFVTSMWMVMMLIIIVAVPLVDLESVRQLRLARTVFVLDATHLHEFRAKRLAHLKDAGPTIRRRSLRIDRIASVQREDAEGYASFDVRGDTGRFEMRCLTRSEEAGEVERLLGSLKGSLSRREPMQREALATA